MEITGYVNEMLDQGEESAKAKLKEKRQEARRLRKTLPEDEDPEQHKAFVRKITVLLFAGEGERRKKTKPKITHPKKTNRLTCWNTVVRCEQLANTVWCVPTCVFSAASIDYNKC